MTYLLNNVLSKLPLNGYKAILGGVVTALYYTFPDLPKEELGKVSDLVAQLVGIAGQLYLVAGVIHKYVKAKIASKYK